MIQLLANILQRRTPRERAQLTAAVLIITPLVAIFAIIEPFMAENAEAHSAHQTSVNLEQWLRIQKNETAFIFSQAEQKAPPQSVAPIGVAAVEQSLIVANLREDLSWLTPLGDRKIDLGFDEISLETLSSWLAVVTPEWGYQVEQYEFDALVEPGIVSAKFLLDPIK